MCVCACVRNPKEKDGKDKGSKVWFIGEAKLASRKPEINFFLDDDD